MELAMREKTLVEAGYVCNGNSRMI